MKKVLLFQKRGFRATLDKMIGLGIAKLATLVAGDTSCIVVQSSILEEGISTSYGAGYVWIATVTNGDIYMSKTANPYFRSVDTTPTVKTTIQSSYATIDDAIAAYTASEGRTKVN